MDKYNELMCEYMLIHGHEQKEIVTISEDMANFMVDLAGIDTDNFIMELSNMRRRDVLNKGREFYDTYFRVHDIYYAIDKMVHKLNKYNIDNYEELVEKFNMIGKRISPYKLPVRFNQKKETDSFLGMLSVDVDNEYFLKNMKPYFSRICLKRRPTILTPASYIHELGHLQVESNKGIIKDYNNTEVIPILLEFISLINDEKLFKYNLKQRIDFLLIEFDSLFSYYYEPEKEIDTFQAFLTSKYIVSLLKVFNLLSIYMDGDIRIKKEMLMEIQNIFDNQRSVEEFINKYDDDFDIMKMKKMIGVR